MEKYDKRVNKKTGEELQQYLAWRRKGGKIPAKKGKGSYKRDKSWKKEVAQDVASPPNNKKILRTKLIYHPFAFYIINSNKKYKKRKDDKNA